MFNKPMTDDYFKALGMNLKLYIDSHPNTTMSLRRLQSNRLLEKYHYGVTSRDLDRGYEVAYVEQDGKYFRIQNQLQGAFVVGGEGNNSTDAPVQAKYARTKFKQVGKGMSVREVCLDKQIMHEINLTDVTTGTDPAGAGVATLDHLGIDTGFGATPGVILPSWMNEMLRKNSEAPRFQNIVRDFPMQSMTFRFPNKTTIPSDSTAVDATEAPTAEARAGQDYAISFEPFDVNGWKFLLHSVLSREMLDMISKFIPIQSEYIEDLALAHALLWDYSIGEGLFQMLWTATWRRFVSGSGWTDSEFVPLSGTAGDAILGANAKKHYVFQDTTPGSANYGKLYEPLTATPTKYLTSLLRGDSTATDDIYEGILALATLQKNKKSALEFVMIPPRITELLMKDSRFLSNFEQTGNPQFQTESGFLGQIAIGGSAGRVDLWEYQPEQLIAKVTTDTTPANMDVIYGGRYGRSWNLGRWLPTYFRTDDGREVVARGIGGTSVVRPNETTIITAGSAGSSFPGNHQDLSMLLCVNDTAHG